MATYGILNVPELSDDELQQLRRQQAAFRKEELRQDRANRWLAYGALAAPAIFGGAALGSALRVAPKVAPRSAAPVSFPAREPVIRGGSTYANRIGQRAHKHYGGMADAKMGWKGEYGMQGSSGANIRLDVKPPRDRFIEVKPNTPSGRRAGDAALRRYERETGWKGRVLYYDPKKFR